MAALVKLDKSIYFIFIIIINNLKIPVNILGLRDRDANIHTRKGEPRTEYFLDI